MDAADNGSLVELAKTDPVKAIEIFVDSFIAKEGLSLETGRKKTQFLVYELIDEELMGVTLKEEHKEGGYEGAGEYTAIVIALMNDGNILSYVQYEGYYDSYEGTEWDPLNYGYRVEPRQVTVTQYFEVK